MKNLELADLVLRQLYDAKEQNPSSIHNVESLIKDLNEHNNDLSVTEEQVNKAVDYLHEREYVKGIRSLQGSFMFISIATLGEDIIDSDLNVREVARRTFEPSQTNTTNATIHGNVNQFAQGNNNTQIQNNHAETADELFDELIEFLKQHGETKIADEAKAEKESGGIRKAAKFIADKVIGGFLTKLSQDGAQQVMAAIPAITQALPQ